MNRVRLPLLLGLTLLMVSGCAGPCAGLPDQFAERVLAAPVAHREGTWLEIAGVEASETCAAIAMRCTAPSVGHLERAFLKHPGLVYQPEQFFEITGEHGPFKLRAPPLPGGPNARVSWASLPRQYRVDADGRVVGAWVCRFRTRIPDVVTVRLRPRSDDVHFPGFRRDIEPRVFPTRPGH